MFETGMMAYIELESGQKLRGRVKTVSTSDYFLENIVDSETGSKHGNKKIPKEAIKIIMAVASEKNEEQEKNDELDLKDKSTRSSYFISAMDEIVENFFIANFNMEEEMMCQAKTMLLQSIMGSQKIYKALDFDNEK